MTVKEIMAELQTLGNAQIKSILLKHGVREPLFGVRVGDMKPIQKKIRKDYQLARELYATGNADAMYLAGLIADDARMSRQDLEGWVRQALSQNISEYTVPWVAAGSPHGYELALQWIDAKEEHIAAAGWATLGSIVYHERLSHRGRSLCDAAAQGGYRGRAKDRDGDGEYGWYRLQSARCRGIYREDRGPRRPGSRPIY